MVNSMDPQHPSLERLSSPSEHAFQEPSKKIHEGEDVTFFLTSKAYTDIMTLILQLNLAMFPRTNASRDYQASPAVSRLGALLDKLGDIIEEAPPDPGPRRFGNIAFKKWYQIVESRTDELLQDALPETPKDSYIELRAYLLGSFGSAQRLDYGSGHELSFLAFLGCIWKLGGFAESASLEGQRSIVLKVFDPYLQLIRRLIKTYNLEPAGSHGVWGLDDHSFVPYIFGSAQLAPKIADDGHIPAEGSSPGAPDPGDVAKAEAVERQRRTNMYFDAVGFIYDVKRGPFWEHSPMLYDISGVRAGWAKINKGMIKMYNAEVLSKFPVVQHFPFGSLFRWEKDPNAVVPSGTAHTSNQPTSQATNRHHGPPSKASEFTTTRPLGSSTSAPWATNSKRQNNQPSQMSSDMSGTKAPWAKAAPKVEAGSSSTMPMPPTRAPWAQDR